MEWVVKSWLKKGEKLKKPVLVEGLPGIGNVGKIALDYIIDNVKTKKIYEFSSDSLPHSVFVNEKHYVSLPSITIYLYRTKSQDFLLLGGQVQPTTEESCYAFCRCLLEILKELNCELIVTLGGIGLVSIPEKPKVYCTGASPKFIKEYAKGADLLTKVHGIVGPVMGVTGLLLGLSPKYRIKSVTLLAETFGHPMYYGIHGGQEILLILNKKHKLNVNFKKLEEEITKICEGEDTPEGSIDQAMLRNDKISYIG